MQCLLDCKFIALRVLCCHLHKARLLCCALLQLPWARYLYIAPAQPFCRR